MHTPCAAQPLEMLLQTPHRRVCISQHLPHAAQSDVSPNLHGTHRPRTLLADDSRVARTHNPAVEQAVMTSGARGGTTGIALARARASPWPLAPGHARGLLSGPHPPQRRPPLRKLRPRDASTSIRSSARRGSGECRRETSARLRTPAHAAERQRHRPRRAPTKRARGSPLRRPTAETLAPTPPRPRPAGPAPISRRTT